MNRWALLAPLLLSQGVLSACALPHGSFARPVEEPAEGTNLIALGAMVPFAFSAGVTDGGDGSTASDFAQAFLLIPALSYDRNFAPRHSFGVEIALISGLTVNSADGFDAYGILVNPRWEYGVAENFSITVDGNLGYLAAEGSGVPYLHPTFGIRWYLPTGFGGVILSQQIGTGFITLYVPGSIAYDIPIPLGDTAKLHVFPEFRWDPTFVFLGSAGGYLVAASGGLSFMLEI